MVAHLLQQRGWYVIPSYDYTGEEDNKAPRLQGLHNGYVVPDLDIAREGKRMWVEVKTKWAATYTRKLQRHEHGIPMRHYEAYRRVQDITGCKVWLFIYEESTGYVLCGQLDDLSRSCRKYFGNKMSRGGMVFFPREAFQVFARLSPMALTAGENGVAF